MLRSLFAIIVAVIAGLSVARFIEAATASLRASPASLGDGALPFDHQLTLVVGWFVGAAVASALALLLGRKWAPLGFLASGTILFSAIITILTFSLNWLIAAPAAIATAFAAYGVHILMKPQMDYPQGKAKRDYFSE